MGPVRSGAVDCCPRQNMKSRIDENFNWITKIDIKFGKKLHQQRQKLWKNFRYVFIPEACHDFKETIPMIDRLSVKKSHQLFEEEILSKSLVLRSEM